MFQVVLRMRELFRSGVAPGAVGPRVDAEMKAGTLRVPAHPAVGYRVLGGPDAYNPATGVATERLDVWQSIHVPFATAEQLRLPDESTMSDAQVTAVPFVMASGTGWAHVMIMHHAATGAIAPRTSTSGADAKLADDIRFAVLPLPEQMRDVTTVMRMDSTRVPVVVRQGSNGMVCMRFIPGDDVWDARCYDAAMFQALMRVRELRRTGVTGDSIDSRIKAELLTGTLTLPGRPTMGYRVLGGRAAYDPATGPVATYMKTWQTLQIPFATAKELRIPDESTVAEPQQIQMPYVMGSGAWSAHVMIEHPAPPASKP